MTTALRNYKVAVYNNHSQSEKHTNRPLAYTTYFSAGACIHNVEAANGNEAKKKAKIEHSSCSQDDIYCDRCKAGVA